MLEETDAFRDPTVYDIALNPQLVPTRSVTSAAAFTLADCVYLEGKEVRDADGDLVTTLILAAGVVHFIALTSFTVSAATATVRANLAEPWQALVEA